VAVGLLVLRSVSHRWRMGTVVASPSLLRISLRWPPFPPFFSRFISKRQSSPLPRVSRFPRAPRFPPPFTLSAPTNVFSFRVARCILLLLLLLAEFVNASHNRVRIITYLCVSESRKEKYSILVRDSGALQHESKESL